MVNLDIDKIRKIVREALENAIDPRMDSIANAIVKALHDLGSFRVNDGDNEILGLNVAGRKVDIYFTADVSVYEAQEPTMGTYDYPGDDGEYEYNVDNIYFLHVFRTDMDEIDALQNNDAIITALMEISYADSDSMDIGYEYEHQGKDPDAAWDNRFESKTSKRVIRESYQDTYDYYTDLIDQYYNMMEDGHILSGYQLRQVSEVREWLASTNTHDNPYTDNWIKMATEIIKRFDGRGTGMYENVGSSVARELSKMLTESLVSETRTVDADGTIEIDNFDKIRQIISFDNPGDTLYFIELIRRKKDNPYMHGSREFVKQYYLKSIDEFNAAEDEIKKLCRTHNARAYMYINARSAADVDKYTKIYMDRFRRHPSMGDKFQWNAKAFAAGRSFDEPNRPLCFVDIDSTDMNDIKNAMHIIRSAGIKPLYAYRSLNNGLHIILPNKDDAKKLDFSSINGNLNGLSQFAKNNAKVSVEIDKPVTLYAALIPNGYDKQNARFQKFVNQRDAKNQNMQGKHK